MMIRPALQKLRSLRPVGVPPTARTSVARALGLLALFVGLSFAYLYPGSLALVERRTDVVMSDDTDVSPLPYVYDSLVRAVKDDWRRVFYGAVLLDQGHPRHDAPAWYSWSERTIVLVGHYLWPLEQLSTWVAVVIMVMSASAFYAMGRAWSWSRPVAFGLAIAWAFNPFTRARAKVHTGMAGTFHLPLIFLGLHLVARGRTWRSVVGAALCFLVTATSLQYLLITAAVLSPFYLAELAFQRGNRPWSVLLRRALTAALPAVLLLAWSLLRPVPDDPRLAGLAKFPQTGRMPAGVVHPFLTTYAARPLDYLGGDLALGSGFDWNRARARLDAYTLDHLENSMPHERTNGIRWSLIVIALCAVVLARGSDRRRTWMFLSFGAASFWLSLGPDAPFAGMGASRWLWELIPQMRVPSRAGIGVHFAVLALAGTFLGRARGRGRRVLARALPLVVLLEYLPLATPMPMAPVRPRYDHFARGGSCATGLFFPYVSDDLYPVIYYHFKQRARATGCTFLNALDDPAQVQNLRTRFPTSNEYLRTLGQSDVAVRTLVHLARCAPLGWIAFDEVTPPAFRERVCRELGWESFEDLTCVSPRPVATFTRNPDVCP